MVPNSLNITEISDLLRMLWTETKGIVPPILLIGPPGGGKTTICEALPAELGMLSETLMGNNLEPSDILGLPYREGGTMHFAPPEWAVRLAGKRAVLLFDELNTARPATLAALLRVILERKAGNVALGPQVHIVATMNPPSDAAGGWPIPPAVANRFLHINVAPTTVPQWQAWATKQDETPEYHELVRTFPLPSLYGEPTDGPFASPRAWHFAFKAAAAMQRCGKPALVQTVVSAAVGAGTAISWRDALRTQDVVEIEKMDPGTVQLIMSRELQKFLADTSLATPFCQELAELAQHHPSIVYTFMGKHKAELEPRLTDVSPDCHAALTYIHGRSSGTVDRSVPPPHKVTA